MLEARIIELVEESEWISPIVVKDKKATGEVRIYVDLRKLSDAFLHDRFLTPFIDEVLESVGGQEMYSFIDRLSRNHKIIITREECHKTTFIT